MSAYWGTTTCREVSKIRARGLLERERRKKVNEIYTERKERKVKRSFTRIQTETLHKTDSQE